MLTRILLLSAAVSGIPVVLAQPSANGVKAAEPTGAVHLHLSKASAERLESGELLFKCDAVLDNDTGKELKIKSSYYSAFDGLDLVIFNEEGKKLRQQSYLYHQSFFTLNRTFPLSTGKNSKTLVFPIRDLSKNTKNVRVLLLGTLPGSEYSFVVCSDMVTVSTPSLKK
jgi:hypothetical protein